MDNQEEAGDRFRSNRRTIEGHGMPVTTLSFSPNGTRIASASADRSVKIWDVQSGLMSHTLSGHVEGISEVNWSHDGRYICSASDDRTVRLHCTETGNCITNFKGHHKPVSCASINPSGDILASGSVDESVNLYNVSTGTMLHQIPAHSKPVSALAFSRDGSILVTCGYDGAVRFWDMNSLELLKSISILEKEPVVDVCFSPNFQFVLVTLLDDTVRLWDYGNDTVVKEFNKKMEKSPSRHKTRSRFFCINEYYYIVSGGLHSSFFIWDIQTRIRQRLRHSEITGCHDDVVLAIDTFSGSDNTPLLCTGVFSNSGPNQETELGGYQPLPDVSDVNQNNIKIWEDWEDTERGNP